MGAFDRYAPFVQEYIYRNHWENLRAIQVAAADAIFNTDDNVLLTASTASGKTEAAFFPIITLFSEDMPASIGCIYIGPLKALINDQFLRLNELCDEAGISVWHWHGDVARSHKEKLMKHPSGILQITPESMESMLINRSNDDFVVNDGERIAQMVIAAHEQGQFETVTELDTTERGEGGYGHTGVK